MILSKKFRELVNAEISKRKENALMFSGGVDSATILAAMLDCQRKPDLYTFIVGDKDSKDSLVAKAMAKEFDLKITIVKIPEDITSLINDIKQVILITKRSSKTHIQCSHPWLYLSEAAAKDGHTSALIGMSADGLYGTNRKGEITYKVEGELAFREFRNKKHEDYFASDSSVFRVSKSFGVSLWDLYAQYTIGDFMLKLSYEEMHTPKQKSLSVDAFPEFWSRGNWYRTNQPLQIVSGLRELHDKIVDTEFNKRESKTVVGVYNDIAAELKVDTKITEWHRWEGER